MIIKVSDVIESDSATIRDQGLAVYTLIKKELQDGKKVIVSFEGISMIISSFLNASIGKLYGDFDFNLIDEKLTIIGLDDDDLNLLNSVVIPNAKDYYADSNKIEQIEQSVIGSK